MDELEQGTTDTQEGADLNQDTGDLGQGDQTPGISQQTQPEPNEFEKLIPPNELPDELKGHWKRMHGAYSKLLNNQRELQQKAAVVDQFYSNQDYARQVLIQWASQNGYQLAPIGQQHQQQQQAQAQQQFNAPPAEFVDAVRARLKPELQWMAEDLAASQWTAQQMLLQPLIQQSQKAQYEQRSQEWDGLADQLSETAPGWEEHEPVMDELLQFLQSPAMKHPKFGSKLQLLYNAITSNAAAVAEATNRMNRAVRNSGRVGGNARVVSNLQDQIRKASSNNQAWELAKRAALNASGGDDY